MEVKPVQFKGTNIVMIAIRKKSYACDFFASRCPIEQFG